jgi:DnaK suppressor protein
METELADDGTEVEEAEVATSDVDPGSPSDLSIDEVDRLLDEVEGALARLDDGTYGTCAACGGPIDDGYLAGSPTARTCEACTPPSDG